MVNLRNRQLNGCRGMTLVEMVVVMAILSVVMMAVMSLYIPAHQSTVTQTQVSDVHANLRLALNTMTRDLLTAGFLEPRYPVVFPDADPNFTDDTLNDKGTVNNTEFIIRTRAVGSGFARVAEQPTYSGDTFHLKLADTDMVQNFPVGSKFRIFGAMNGTDLVGAVDGTVTNANRVLTVSSYNSSTLDADISAATLSSAQKDDLKQIMLEAVLIRVKDDGQPPLQTIRYRLNNGALERIVNGTTQILARNLDDVFFNYEENDQNRIKIVHIRLTGQTKALKDDVISGEKTREASTSVKLRNIN